MKDCPESYFLITFWNTLRIIQHKHCNICALLYTRRYFVYLCYLEQPFPFYTLSRVSCGLSEEKYVNACHAPNTVYCNQVASKT